MMEMKITIEVPDLAAAIEKLAAAMTAPNAVPTPVVVPVASQVVPANPVPANPAKTAPVEVPVSSLVHTTGTPTMTGSVAPFSNASVAGPAMPVSSVPTYTLDQISKAGASLVDAGKMEPLQALLAKYGVQAVTQLQPNQYGVFATELRALGAQI